MAATATAQSPETSRGKDLKGLQHMRQHFTDVSTGNSWDTGLQLVHVAWEPDSLSDEMAVTIQGGTTVLFIQSTASPVAGTAHIWSRDFTG